MFDCSRNSDDDPFMAEESRLLPVFIVFSSISILISLITMFFFLFYRNIRRNLALHIIFLLAIFEILMWANELIQYIHKLHTDETFSSNVCIFFAFLLTFSDLMNFSLITCIPFQIYLEFRHLLYFRIHHQYLLFLICLLFSLIMAAIPLGLGSYGPLENMKCYICNDNSFLFFYSIPLWVFIGLNILLSVKVFLIIQDFGVKDKLVKSLTKKFLLYPLVMIVCWFPASFHIANFGNDPTFRIFVYLLMPCECIFNSLIFVMINSFVKEKIKKVLTCGCYKKNSLEEKLFIESVQSINAEKEKDSRSFFFENQ